MRATAALAAAAACGAAAGAPHWQLPDGALTDSDLTATFDAWKVRWNKTYATPDEEVARRGIFAENMRWVIDNDRRETHGATIFADKSEDEFKKQYLASYSEEQEAEEAERRRTAPRWDGETCHTCLRFPEMAEYDGSAQGASLDWTTKGAVVRPKDQGQCNTCYAFGSSGDIESAWFMAGNKLVSVSEQMMLDCSGVKKTCGEHSGTRTELFKYVIKNGGVSSESAYPYREAIGSCQTAKAAKTVAHIDSYLQISDSTDGEAKMYDALGKLGPFSIGISAVRMELYGGGIITGSCNTKHDHAPTIVGYGTQGGTDYWKARNSWGSYWGEGGYFRIVRNQNKCGLATDAVHTVVGGGARYGCDAATKQCTAGPRGHATLAKCKAVCGVPTPPPAPPTPRPPTPPPTPPITRYHCINETAQCWEVPPGYPGVSGHSTLESCQSKCYSKGGYKCNTANNQCEAVASGGDKLHSCQDQCKSPPTPLPQYTPVPPPPVRYHCQQDIFGEGKCVESDQGHSTMAKCQAACTP